jgi:hypothetical protein
MKRDEIRAKIEEVKAQLKSNSKDAHFAEKLIGDLLSLKGQYEHQPTMVHVAMDDILGTLEGNTFTIYKTKSGDTGFHLKAGYDIVVRPTVESLNKSLASFVDYQKDIEKLSEEERERYEQDLVATQFCLTIPMYAFADMDFKYKVANMFADYMLKIQHKLLDNVVLQNETPEENKTFEQATMGLETIKSEL